MLLLGAVADDLTGATDLALMLARGTWHAGPLFDAPQADFFNLELADTNVVDHQSCDLRARFGLLLRLVG